MVFLFLSTPCYGGLCLEHYAGSVIMLQRLCLQKGYQLYVDTTENESLIPRARNCSIARFMQKPEYTHFMFIDADIHFDPQAVINLIECEHEISVAVYPKKTVAWDQVEKGLREGDTRDMDMLSSSLVTNFAKTNTKIVEGFIEVLDGPTGFMMIKRAVIDKMYEHYKDTLTCKNDHAVKEFDEYVAIFDCIVDPESKRYLSEDYAFCRRWQQMGGKIYADVRTTLGHVGNLSFKGKLGHRLRN
jgi:hypothetical protein